ncbi:hypothetical protein ACO1PF_00530 [Alkalibacterium sp. f15]|uniref:hypothetical protein n=1 Tax=Alkalibacterium sp. f15 TaxID=3414029 RepID=UPI003BF9048C
MDKVKIGGTTYKVEMVDDLAGSDDCFGYIQYKKSLIQLDNNLEEQMHNKTFIHELTHALFIEAGYNDHEEDMANRIGLVLYQALKDNDFSFIR